MKNIKFLALGLIGGLIPLTLSLLTNSTRTFEKPNLSKSNKTSNAFFTNSNSSPVNSSIDFVAASKSSVNTVVHITTKVETTSFQRDIFSEFFYGPGAGGREFKQYGSGSGSGVIVTEDGYIVTNNHVIEDAKEIQVTLNDNRKYDAEIIGSDPSTDIAVLKIKEKDLTPIVIGNSDNIQIGEWVLAVGNPFNLTSTVTAGIISAKGRNINLLQEKGNTGNVPIESFIQTDAAVNPGNSGGALVNTEGHLIGINTAIASQTGSYSGYSFAIPVNLVKKVMSDLIDYGIVQRGYLGVQIVDITQEIKEENELIDTEGVFVAKVIDDGAASMAGIKQGDVILKVGTKEIKTVAELQEEVGKGRPGDKIPVTIRTTKGSTETKDIILRNKDGQTKLVSKEEIKKNTALGATFIELSSKDKRELNIETGVKIQYITSGKLKSLGLSPGMIITKVNNEAISSVEQLAEKLNGVNRGILLEVLTESGRKEYVGFGL